MAFNFLDFQYDWNLAPFEFVVPSVFLSVGKLPASSMNDEKLEVLMKYEQEKIDKLLSKYISFCGQVS